MPGVGLSLRLSPVLAAGLDELASQLDYAPGDVVDSLLLAAPARDAEIRGVAPTMPFTERRSFRVSAEGAAVLRSSGAPSWYGRQVLTYFLGNRSALRQALGAEAAPVARSPVPAFIVLGVCTVLLLAVWYFVLGATSEDSEKAKA